MLKPVNRSTIAAAKIAGAVLAAVAVNTIGAVALGGAHAITTGSSELLLPFLVGAALASTVYAAIFVPFGFLTDRAVVVGLIFVAVFENGVAATLPGMASLSPWRIGFSAFAGLLPATTVQLVPSFALGNVTAGAGGALIKTVAVLALTIAATTWLVRHRDLT